MFKKLINEMKQLDGSSVNIPMDADAEGYLDRECPSEPCLFNFKVFRADWRDICRDEEVFCPACRHAAPSKSWFTREQIQRAKEYACSHVIKLMNDAMRSDAQEWNCRQPRNAFIKLTMDVRGTDPILIPVAAAQPMRLKAKCDSCGCRYSYIGAAFFCPSCGANSARHTFRQTLDAIRSAASMDATFRATFDADQAEVLTRTLLEKGVLDAVMSFQRLAEQVFASLPNCPHARRNAFQNLDAGAALWCEATGASFLDGLSSDEIGRLRKYYQQRHLLAHQQGIVDEDYRCRSGDLTYITGQRLVVRRAEVLDFVDLVERIGKAVSASSAA